VRIASVLPSATEIVCALGARQEIVARSAECDYPPEVASVPVVMRARTLDGGRSSAEIDARVRATRGRGESLYFLDTDLLRSTRPEVLLTQDLCGVCSVTEAEVAEACAQAGVNPAVVSLTPRTLAEVWATFGVVGRAIGRLGEALRLTDLTRERLPQLTSPPGVTRVAIVEWMDPPILAGLWTPDIVSFAGGTPLGPASGEPGRRTTWEELARLAPDLLVVSPCSFSVARTLRELRSGAIADHLRRVRAPLGTFVADEAYFSRPGPRLADGVDLVRALLRRSSPPSPMPVVRWVAGATEAVA
jgi:iron complex transport system substrate-binding protein